VTADLPEPFGLPGSRAQLARALAAQDADADQPTGQAWAWCEPCWTAEPESSCGICLGDDSLDGPPCSHCGGSGRCPVAGRPVVVL